MSGRISGAAEKYGVVCPRCKSREIWKVGFRPTAAGRMDAFKCTVCAHSFYKGQPGTNAPAKRVKTAKAKIAGAKPSNGKGKFTKVEPVITEVK